MYTFTRTGSTWTQQQKLLATDSATTYGFGSSVIINEDNALIGAPLDNDNGTDSGSAYVFTYTNNTWTQHQKILASDGTAGDHFGSAVALKGNISLIGAPYDDDNATFSGSAYIFTQHYDHDVGVTAITEPCGPPVKDISWFTYGGDNANSIGLTSGGTFEGAIRMTPAELTPFDGQRIVSVKYCHGMLSGSGEPATDGYMKIYGPGSATQPGDLLVSEPFHTPAGNDWFQYNFMNQVTVDATQDLWFSIEVDNIPAGAYPLGVDAGPVVDGKSDWASLDGGATWVELQIYGLDNNWNHMVGFGYPPPPTVLPPGTYPVAALVKNFGVTNLESNIPVNAKITHLDNNTIIYNYDEIVPGPLAPNQTSQVTFPNVTFYNSMAWAGNYKLEIQTMLPGDDHPYNNKKTMIFLIYCVEHDVETECTLAGATGNNGWYVSNVTIWLNGTVWNEAKTLNNLGPKPPNGINHTYYSFDDIIWYEYLGPLTVMTDGYFTIYYYSVDKCIPPCVEPVNSTNFKIDKTAPLFINFTATPENWYKTEWLLSAQLSEPTSGVAKVEFYIDDQIVGNATSTPWDFHYQGRGKIAQAIAYDVAGNSAMSNRVQDLSLILNSQPVQSLNRMLSVQQTLKLK